MTNSNAYTDATRSVNFFCFALCQMIFVSVMATRAWYQHTLLDRTLGTHNHTRSNLRPACNMHVRLCACTLVHRSHILLWALEVPPPELSPVMIASYKRRTTVSLGAIGFNGNINGSCEMNLTPSRSRDRWWTPDKSICAIFCLILRSEKDLSTKLWIIDLADAFIETWPIGLHKANAW